MNKDVLYTASWCKPCDKLKLRLEEENLLNKVDVVQIDEIVQELKSNIGLRSVPTLRIEDELVTEPETIFNTLKGKYL